MPVNSKKLKQKARQQQGFKPVQQQPQRQQPAQIEPAEQVAIAEATTASNHLATVTTDIAQSRLGYVEALEQHQDNAADQIAERVANLIDPANFDKLLAGKIIEKTSGFNCDSPFTIPALTLPPLFSERMVALPSTSTNTLPASAQTVETYATSA
jgi:hypothetical protein